jgi:predicted metal-dependent hydrolase
MKKQILLGDRVIEYDLQRKNVKNINIRIKSNLSVQVSASSRVTQSQIDNILKEKAAFILSAIEKYENGQNESVLRNTEGDEIRSVSVFGKVLPIETVSGMKNKAVIETDRITVTLKDKTDSAALKKAIQSALDDLCRQTVTEMCQLVYPKFEKHLPHFPEIKFRHMTSRWGSCNYKKYILTFNYHLISAPIECIEYVVYHEFTHFIHPDHSKAFYNTLSQFSTRHKELKNALKKTIIT